MNILFLSNIATPYQLDVLHSMNSQEDMNMYGYFLFSKEKNRTWSLELPDYVTVADYSKTINNYISFYRFIKSNKIDKVIIGGYSLPMVYFTIVLSFVMKIDIYFWLERPITVQYGIKKYLKEIYLKLVLQNAKKVFAIGRLSVQRYTKYHHDVINLPYSMNLDKFYQIKREEIQNKKIRFLFSGQYIDRKNIINTINAFKSIENKNISLTLIGGGELQSEVNKLVENDDRIIDAGFIQPDELSNIYKNHDIFLMPSKHDGWALVINEAMASSMPVISTIKVGAVAEYLQHAENGFVCEIDKQSIKNGIEYYIEKKENIFKHGQLNREVIKNSKADVNNFTVTMIESLND